MLWLIEIKPEGKHLKTTQLDKLEGNVNWILEMNVAVVFQILLKPFLFLNPTEWLVIPCFRPSNKTITKQ